MSTLELTEALLERAQAIRMSAAHRLLRRDGAITPEEAILLVIDPDEDVLDASIRAALAERGCRRCGHDLDMDCFCPMCGEVTTLSATGS